MPRVRFVEGLRTSPLGIVGLFVFAILVFIVPSAHQINHRDDHDHDRFGWHAHGLGEHHHDEQGRDVPSSPSPAHGRGSLDHFGAAFCFLAPLVLPPVAGWAIVLAPTLAPEWVHVDRIAGPACPRGPPARA